MCMGAAACKLRRAELDGDDANYYPFQTVTTLDFSVERWLSTRSSATSR